MHAKGRKKKISAKLCTEKAPAVALLEKTPSKKNARKKIMQGSTRKKLHAENFTGKAWRKSARKPPRKGERRMGLTVERTNNQVREQKKRAGNEQARNACKRAHKKTCRMVLRKKPWLRSVLKKPSGNNARTNCQSKADRKNRCEKTHRIWPCERIHGESHCIKLKELAPPQEHTKKTRCWSTRWEPVRKSEHKEPLQNSARKKPQRIRAYKFFPLQKAHECFLLKSGGANCRKGNAPNNNCGVAHRKSASDTEYKKARGNALTVKAATADRTKKTLLKSSEKKPGNKTDG